jgi:hypothetical protein
MYRKLSKRRREDQARRLEAMRRGKERARLARPAEGRAPELPELRREVVVIDYDSGEPVTHTLHLFKTKRVVCCTNIQLAEKIAKPANECESLRASDQSATGVHHGYRQSYAGSNLGVFELRGFDWAVHANRSLQVAFRAQKQPKHAWRHYPKAKCGRIPSNFNLQQVLLRAQVGLAFQLWGMATRGYRPHQREQVRQPGSQSSPLRSGYESAEHPRCQIWQPDWFAWRHAVQRKWPLRGLNHGGWSPHSSGPIRHARPSARRLSWREAHSAPTRHSLGIEADGRPWKCCGWSAALEGLRKAYPRVPSPRSDFWS